MSGLCGFPYCYIWYHIRIRWIFLVLFLISCQDYVDGLIVMSDIISRLCDYKELVLLLYLISCQYCLGVINCAILISDIMWGLCWCHKLCLILASDIMRGFCLSWVCVILCTGLFIVLIPVSIHTFPNCTSPAAASTYFFHVHILLSFSINMNTYPIFSWNFTVSSHSL